MIFFINFLWNLFFPLKYLFIFIIFQQLYASINCLKESVNFMKLNINSYSFDSFLQIFPWRNKRDRFFSWYRLSYSNSSSTTNSFRKTISFEEFSRWIWFHRWQTVWTYSVVDRFPSFWRLDNSNLIKANPIDRWLWSSSFSDTISE